MNKNDFKTAVERIRISLSRDDITKVWNYIDSKQRGFIDLSDMSVAFANRVSNFGKTIENVIEQRAVDGYRNQQTTKTDSTVNTHAGSPSSGGVSKTLKAQRDQYKINVG